MRPFRFPSSLLAVAMIVAAPVPAGGSRPPIPVRGAISPARLIGPPEPRDPRLPLSPLARRWVDSTLASLSPRQRAAQLIHLWLVGDYESDTDSAWATTVRWVRDESIGGLTISVGSPIEVAVKLNALQTFARVPLLIGCDVEPALGRMEGGYFIPSMIKGGSATLIPTNMAIGATGDTALAYRAGLVVGRESRAVGIHMAFAPVADVNNNPANPVINVRSFGEDPGAVADMVAAFTRGLQDGGVLATVKHFPGHGDTGVDSHLALPIVRLSHAHLDSTEFRPFRASIEAGAAGVMSAHISNPVWLGDNVPATLQRRVLHDELRDSLHFTGLTLTDALTMQGVARQYSQAEIALRAVRAGAEVLLKPDDVASVLDALTAESARDTAFAALIDAATRKNLEMKARVGLHLGTQMSLTDVRSTVGIATNRAVGATVAARSVTVLRDRTSQLPIAGSRPLQLVIYTPETELGAGNAFTDEMRRAGQVSVTRIGPLTTAGTLDSLTRRLTPGRVVVLTVVRRVEGAGRVAIAPQVAAWVARTAAQLKPVVVAAGNPYVISQYREVGAYVATFSVGENSERAAARVITGRAPATGRAPVSLPGVFSRGDGLQTTQPR